MSPELIKGGKSGLSSKTKEAIHLLANQGLK